MVTIAADRSTGKFQRITRKYRLQALTKLMKTVITKRIGAFFLSGEFGALISTKATSSGGAIIRLQ